MTTPTRFCSECGLAASPRIRICRGCGAKLGSARTSAPPWQSGDAQAHYERGNAFVGEDEYKRAIAEFDEAIRLDPQLANAYYNRGVSYHSLGQHERAIQDYDEAIRLNPQYAIAYGSRGIAYYNLGQYGRSIQDFNKATRLDPLYAIAYLSREDAYSVIGKSGKPPSVISAEPAASPVVREPRISVTLGARSTPPDAATAAKAPPSASPKAEEAQQAAAPKTDEGFLWSISKLGFLHPKKLLEGFIRLGWAAAALLVFVIFGMWVLGIVGALVIGFGPFWLHFVLPLVPVGLLLCFIGSGLKNPFKPPGWGGRE